MTDTYHIEDGQKVDRRIIRTRLALRTALLGLINEKDFDSISIEEITARANLGRATFYLHYTDKEDLILEEFREIVKDRVRVLSELPISIWQTNQFSLPDPAPLMPLLLMFEHTAENGHLYRILFRSKNSQRITQYLRDIFISAIHEILNNKLEFHNYLKQSNVPVDFLAAYFSGALIGSLNWWLEKEIPPSPTEMAQMFQSLFFIGVIKTWSPE